LAKYGGESAGNAKNNGHVKQIFVRMYALIHESRSGYQVTLKRYVDFIARLSNVTQGDFANVEKKHPNVLLH
jgi:hypothetical protein